MLIDSRAGAQQTPCDQVGDESDDADDQHRGGQDLGWLLEAPDGLIDDKGGEAEQQHRVGKGGEDLQPVQPVGTAAAGGRPVGGHDRRQRHTHPEGVGSHVSAI